jgi:hypothetical protein
LGTEIHVAGPNDFDKGDLAMNSVTLIQVVSGVLFVVVLGVLVQRRRSKVS